MSTNKGPSSKDFENKLDDDQNSVYEIVVSIDDNGTVINGNLNLEISDLNDPPVIEGTDLTQITLNENSDFVRSLVATDQDEQTSVEDILLVIDDTSIECFAGRHSFVLQ